MIVHGRMHDQASWRSLLFDHLGKGDSPSVEDAELSFSEYNRSDIKTARERHHYEQDYCNRALHSALLP